MNYSVKYNNVLLDSSKIDYKTIEKLQVSSDENLFSQRASILKLIYHSTSEDEFTSEYEYNIVEIYRDSSLYWVGYVKEDGIKYDRRKRLYTVTCLDFSKLLKEVVFEDFPLRGDYFDRNIEKTIEAIIVAFNDYLSGKVYDGFELDYSVSSAVTDIDIEYNIQGAIDYAGYSYDFTEYSNRLKLGNLNDSRPYYLFREKRYSGGDYYFYFGILQGTRAFYFSTAEGDRKPLYPDYAVNENDQYLVKNDDEITYYYLHSVASNEHRFKGWRFGKDGKYIAAIDILASTHEGPCPPKQLKYHGDGSLYVADGWGYRFNYTALSDGSILLYEVNAGYISYQGYLTPYRDFPYEYDDEVTALRIMQDLAITFDGFFFMNARTLAFATRSSSVFQTFQYDNFDKKINKISKTIKAISYELSETLKTEYEDFINYLESWYNEHYGGKAKKITYKFRDAAEIDLLSKIDNNRVNNIRRKEIYEGYFDYTVEALHLEGE